MNQEQALALVGRLFTAYGRQPNEAQLDEWVKAQKRFNFRPDDTNAAIDSLISTSNRMPTIAELRTAIVTVQNQRLAQAGHEIEVPGWVRRMNNEHLKEDFEWWSERFGSYAPQARALVGEACKKGKARLAGSIAKLINEMTSDYSLLEASNATGVSVEKLRQAITSGQLSIVPHDPLETPIRMTQQALEAAGYSLIKPKENLSHADRWERLKAHASGTTYTITPPARVAASVLSEF